MAHVAVPATALDPAASRAEKVDVVWMATPDHAKLLYVSPSYEQVWGRRPRPEQGVDSLVLLDAIHPEDRPHVRAALADARERREGFDLEYRVTRPDGDVRRLRDRAYVLRDADGAPERIVGVAEDVTDARAVEDGLDATRRELARIERLSTLGSLVSGLAHEVRTPLSAAMNHVSLLNVRVSRAADAGELPASLAEASGHLAGTLDALDRINALVNRLRTFAAPPESVRARHSLDTVVDEALRIFEPAHRGHVRVEAALEPTRRVLMDKVRVEEVVLRLLENAAEASPVGGTIRVSTRGSPLASEIVVKDEGPGLPPEAQARMFQEFFTTKPGRAGLGLSIARRIVEEHGGAITCRSAPGKGATFVVSLPC